MEKVSIIIPVYNVEKYLPKCLESVLGQTYADSVVLFRQDKSAVATHVTGWQSLFAQAYLEEDRHFIDCILNDKSPAVTGHDGKMAVKVVIEGNRSIREHRIIDLK